MKLQQFRQIIREEVKKVFQEEIKDLLMEALKKPTAQVVAEAPKPVNNEIKKSIKEGYKNILGETAAAFNTSNINQPLQMSGNVDTTSPQGKLPDGEVSMDQIMGLMNK